MFALVSLLAITRGASEYFPPIFYPTNSIPTCATTVVSAHWDTRSKHGLHSYAGWWSKTLALNACYVIYTNSLELAHLMLTKRQNHSTIVLYKPLESFHLNLTTSFRRHIIHVPTLGVASIWNEKVFCLKEAYEPNYYKSDWFAWIDSGNAYARRNSLGSDLWPNKDALLSLPTNKIIYTTSLFPWVDHSFAGTAFMYHKNIVVEVAREYTSAFHQCTVQPSWKCGSDQCLFSDMKLKDPTFFYQVGYGYGNLVPDLFDNVVKETNYFYNMTSRAAEDATAKQH